MNFKEGLICELSLRQSLESGHVSSFNSTLLLTQYITQIQNWLQNNINLINLESIFKYVWIKKEHFGGLAHLARALRWQ
jgi:hypothetical protein